MVEVIVNCRDPRKHKDEVSAALSDFKKKFKKSGIMQELRKREEYAAPSKKKRLKRDAASKQRKRDEKKANSKRD